MFNQDDFHFDPATKSCVCPTGKTMWLQSPRIETGEKSYCRFTGYLKDCRTCSLQSQCMRKPPVKTGRQVQFLTNSKRKPPSYTDKMKVKIDSSVGRRQYSKRLGAIEPVFGNITINKGMYKFTLRG